MISLTNRWAVLGLMYLIGLALPMQFQAVAALAPFLVAEAGLTYTDIGVLTGLFMFPGIVLAIPGGLLAARIGDKLTLLIGLSIMLGSTLLFVASDNYGLMFFSRLLGGAGAVLITILSPKIVADWFVDKEIATAQATIASSFAVGVGLGMALLPSIAASSSWQTAMVANAAVAGLAMILLIVGFRNRETGAAQGNNRPKLWQLNRPEFVLSGLAGTGRGLFSSGYVVFMSFLPILLIGQGMRVVDAGWLTSIAAAVSLVSVPLGGALSDRTGKPNYFIVGGSLGTALSCVLVPYIAPALLWVLLFGVLRGGCTGGIMALPSQVLRPENRSAGFAVGTTMHLICMASFPPIAGYLLDATGDNAAPLWFAGLVWLSIAVLLAVFKMLQRRWIPQ